MFLLQHKKKSQQKRKKLWTKKGTKSVGGSLYFQSYLGRLSTSPSLPFPLLQFLTRHRSGGAGVIVVFVKKTQKSGVCTICAAPLVWDRRKLNQESIVFRDCFSRKNNNLVPCVINLLSPPLSSFLPVSPQSSSSLLPYLYRVSVTSSSVVRKCP